MLIRVFMIPPENGAFCGAGKPVIFMEVDWFRDDGYPPDDEHWQERIEEFVRTKRYFAPGVPLLILREGRTFTIDYKAP